MKNNAFSFSSWKINDIRSGKMLSSTKIKPSSHCNGADIRPP